MAGNPLVGTWRLVSWRAEAADGDTVYPFGTDARGYISYTNDGHVWVAVMRAERGLFAANDPLGGSDAEKIAAMESYTSYGGTSYGGTYEMVAEDVVVHHVTQSLFPNMVGTQQERTIVWEDSLVTLSSQPMQFVGKQRVVRATWAHEPQAA